MKRPADGVLDEIVTALGERCPKPFAEEQDYLTAVVYAVSGPDSTFTDGEYDQLSAKAKEWINGAAETIENSGDVVVHFEPAPKKKVSPAPKVPAPKVKQRTLVKPKRKAQLSPSFQVRTFICMHLDLSLKAVKSKIGITELADSEIASIYYNVHKVVKAFAAAGISIPGAK